MQDRTGLTVFLVRVVFVKWHVSFFRIYLYPSVLSLL